MGNPNGRLQHGHKKRGCPSPTYRTWLGMKRRCSDVKCKDFARYGAKGIAVCSRWNTSFEAFLADMGLRPTPEHTIDRLDPAKGYGPDNCRWATRWQQTAENTTRLKPVDINGIHYHSIAAACRAFGISRTTVNMRLADGHDLIEAITTPVRGLPNRRPRESYLPKHKRSA